MMRDDESALAAPRRINIGCGQRILIYTTCYNMLDGVSMTVRKIEEEILSLGGHVRVLTTRSGNMKNTNLIGSHPNRDVIFLKNSTVIPFVSDKDFDYHLGFSLGRDDIKSIDDFEPTLIHITVPDASSLSIIDYAREKSIPLMGTFHSNYVEYLDHYRGLGFAKPILKAVIRNNYTFLQALYVPTPFVRRHLCSEEYQLDRCTDLKIWGRGYDTKKFNPSKRCRMFRQQIGATDNDVVVCMVSRLVKEKRPDIFANVVRRLYARGVPFRGLFIGAGPCEHVVNDLPNTYFAGWMTTDELSVAYASSDVFLFPSAVETFGNVTLEAAGSGLPLVVEAGCSGHLVDHGRTGYLCQADDTNAFYEATLELALNHVKRKDFSKRARDFSLSFEQHAVVRKMVDNYNQITHQFHTEYQGSHSNRDAAFDKAATFRAGTDGNPPGVSVVECFFFLAFRVIEMMVCTTNCINSRLLPRSMVIPTGQNSTDSGIRKKTKKSHKKSGDGLSVSNRSSRGGGGLVRDVVLDDLEESSETDTASVALGDTERCIDCGERFINFVFFCINVTARFKSALSWALSNCSGGLSFGLCTCWGFLFLFRRDSGKKQDDNDDDVEMTTEFVATVATTNPEHKVRRSVTEEV